MTRHSTALVLAACAAFLSSGAGAQQPGALVPAGLRVPIHAHTAADTVELWAAGDTYKASFHGDFTFIPVLGDYPRVQPVSWRTVGIAAGGQPFLAAAGASTRNRADYRYEYVHAGGVVEAYDVRADGVEQTFTFPTPIGSGDLVVTGALTTDLVAEPRAFRHGEVVLRDEKGLAVATYGAAIAFDAAGRRTPVDTAVDGNVVRLRVPGAWLAGARYPVTIDPVLSRAAVSYWDNASYGEVDNLDIGHDPTRTYSVLAFDRRVANSDRDTWVLYVPDTMNPNSVRVLFTDLGSTYSSLDPCVAHVASEDRWIVAYTRQRFIGVITTSEIAYHVHNANDLSLRTDVTAVPKPAPTDRFQDSHPDVGGSFASTSSGKAFLVFRRNEEGNYSDNAHSDLVCTTIDMRTKAALAQLPVVPTPSGTRYDREYPCVNQVSYGRADGWFVVYQEWNSTVTSREDWDINGYRFDADGRRNAGTFTARNNLFTHQLRPVVEGCHNGSSALGTRYMVGYATLDVDRAVGKPREPYGQQIVVERIDWPLNGSFSRRANRVIASDADPVWWLTDLAYDRDTASHWAATYQYLMRGSVHVAMLGYDAGVVESLSAYAPQHPALALSAICYSQPSGTFPLTYTDDDSQASRRYTVFGQIFQHRGEVAPTPYGQGCGGGQLQVLGRLLSGNELTRMQLTSATPLSLAVFMMSTRATDIPLDAIGMAGCHLLVDPGQLLLNLPLSTNIVGAATLPMPLVANPARLSGTLRWQAAWLAPNANPRGVQATAGLVTTIR